MHKFESEWLSRSDILKILLATAKMNLRYCVDNVLAGSFCFINSALNTPCVAYEVSSIFFYVFTCYCRLNTEDGFQLIKQYFFITGIQNLLHGAPIRRHFSSSIWGTVNFVYELLLHDFAFC